ncbi:MAG: hypothetical protein LC689_01810 [Myxococcales bacterium]|nr:hypothetical protein [Myxococcales bacterium]
MASNLVAAFARRKRAAALFTPGASLVGCEIVVIDDSRDRELADAEEAIIVLRPGDDPGEFERRLVGLRPAWRRPPARYALNQLDARQVAHRVGLRRLRQQLGPRLMEPAIHFDATAPRFPPESQPAADVLALSRLLVPPRSSRDAR